MWEDNKKGRGKFTISFILCGPGLENIRIAPHSRKMMVPKPLDTLLGAFYSRPILIVHYPPFSLFVGGFIVPCDKASADEQDIASTKFGALSFGYGFEILR